MPHTNLPFFFITATSATLKTTHRRQLLLSPYSGSTAVVHRRASLQSTQHRHFHYHHHHHHYRFHSSQTSLKTPVTMTTMVQPTFSPDTRVYSTKTSLAFDLNEHILNIAKECIKENNKFNIAVSGGSAASLAGTPALYNEKMDYSKWNVILVDERIVPWENKDSNGRHVMENFCRTVGVGRNQMLSIKENTEDEEECGKDYEEKLKELLGQNGVIDLVILGLGPDGHTASLFPGHELLQEKDRMVAWLNNSPKPPPKRITLTLPIINKAKHVSFVVAGEEKADAVYEVLKNKDSEPPGRMVNPHNGNLVWFLHESAYSKCK